MMLRVWIANFVLAALVVYFGVSAYKIWEENGDGTPIPAVRDGSTAGPVTEKKFASRLMPQETAYDVVAADNLFSPDREEILPEAPEPEAPETPQASEVRISGAAISLYGVVIRDDDKKALISNPERVARGREQMWVGIGDRLSNLTVDEIRNESILLVEGKKKYEVLLYDKSKEKPRATPPPAASRSADAPTLITHEAPAKASPPAAAHVGKNTRPPEKRMADNPFRRKFPKQNP
jgi:hypothetical protein